MYDWLGSIRELPPFFSIHRPLATSGITRQEIVRWNEGVFVRDLASSSMLSINEKNKTARNWRFIIVVNVSAFRLVKKQRSIFGNIVS